jgi:hypothetical protein
MLHILHVEQVRTHRGRPPVKGLLPLEAVPLDQIRLILDFLFASAWGSPANQSSNVSGPQLFCIRLRLSRLSKLDFIWISIVLRPLEAVWSSTVLRPLEAVPLIEIRFYLDFNCFASAWGCLVLNCFASAWGCPAYKNSILSGFQLFCVRLRLSRLSKLECICISVAFASALGYPAYRSWNMYGFHLFWVRRKLAGRSQAGNSGAESHPQ